MFRKILIANRGEIACRVVRTARRMGIATVAVYSDADRNALHVRMADEAVHIGPAAVAQSYISIDRIMDAVRATGADAVHPGYGFLSENRAFAAALETEGVAFIGPPSGAIEQMGDKITSKKIAIAAGVSTVPGHMDLIADADEAVRISRGMGYPVMIKASAGGGGKGMRIAHDDAGAREGFRASQNEAAASFGDNRIFIEKFVTRPRHIEIQVLADQHGNCVYLHERECSIQRRNQKVIEEAPSPFLDPATRAAMGAQACALARAVGYTSAGTVEFIVDGNRDFFFLEMNTRLQVEHPVTELISGVDLVEQMILVAAGAPLPFTQSDLAINGWAIECRLYAEDPYRGFLPSTGRLSRYRPPTEGPTATGGYLRNDTGVVEGSDISIWYDPMIAKLCSWSATRAGAIAEMRHALDAFEVEGIGHNLPFVAAVMDHPRFAAGDISTAFIAEEYPDGFKGVALDDGLCAQVAASAAAMHRVAEIRRARVSGRMSNHERKVGDDFVVSLQGREMPVHIAADRDGATVDVVTGATGLSVATGANEVDAGAHRTSVRVVSDWVPGQTLARLVVDGVSMVMKVAKISGGFRIRLRGADLAVIVRSPRAAELARLMPEKLPPDMSRYLLCPMPGLLVSVGVAPGDTVVEGQTLATVEAMKMENILRAERGGTVRSVPVTAGSSLKVDDVIVEFE